MVRSQDTDFDSLVDAGNTTTKTGDEAVVEKYSAEGPRIMKLLSGLSLNR